MSTLKKYIEENFNTLNLCPILTECNESSLCIQVCSDYPMDNSEKFIDACYKNILSVFNKVNSKDDEFIILANDYICCCHKSNIKKNSIGLSRYAKKKEILSTIAMVEGDVTKEFQRYFEHDLKEVRHYYMSSKLKDINYKSMIKSIIKGHFEGNEENPKDYYFINKDKNIAFSICEYDMLDVVCKTENELNNLKSTIGLK